MSGILIVDTDVERRDRLAFLLRHSGFHVGFDWGRGCCLREHASAQPDLVLVSESNPELRNWESAREAVRRFDASVIVMGTEAEEVAGIPYLEMGADVYLPTPLDVRELLARVRSLLSRPSRARPGGVSEGMLERAQLERTVQW